MVIRFAPAGKSGYRQYKCFANFPQGDAFGLSAQRVLEAFDRFAQRFEAEPERLMMNRHDEPGASGICHFNRLLGRAMRSDPRIVSADRHDREIEWVVLTQFGEAFRKRCVARKKDPPAISFDNVSVVAAVEIAPFPRAPMFHGESNDFNIANASL